VVFVLSGHPGRASVTLALEENMMAWARLVYYPGGTEEQYRAVVDEIGDAHANAPGRSYFAAGPAEGGWAMLMVWDSQEDFQQWAAEHVGPAHQRAGSRGWQTSPQTTDFSPIQVITERT
jgi:heme-degrading monooxygenase HmoA